MTARPQDGRGRVGEVGTVYLIHFDRRYKHAGHYTGWTKDLSARIAEHLKGQGARLMEVIKEAGITWQVVRTWEGTRDRERAIKNRHEAPKLCPQCSPEPRPVSRGRSAARAGGARPAGAESAQQPQPEPTPGGPGQRSAFERGAAQAERSPRRVPAQRQPGPFTAGVHRGGEWARQMRAAGMTADQIEAAHQAAMAAAPSAAGQWEATHQRGYDASVRSEIVAIRRAAASPQTHERYQGYQAAAAEMINAHRQAQHAEAELAGAELEVG